MQATYDTNGTLLTGDAMRQSSRWHVLDILNPLQRDSVAVHGILYNILAIIQGSMPCVSAHRRYSTRNGKLLTYTIFHHKSAAAQMQTI